MFSSTVHDHGNSINFSYFLNNKHILQTFLYPLLNLNELPPIVIVEWYMKTSEPRLIPKNRI